MGDEVLQKACEELEDLSPEAFGIALMRLREVVNEMCDSGEIPDAEPRYDFD